MRQAGRVRALGSDEHDGSARAGRDEPLEQRRLHRLDGRDDEAMGAVGHVHGASTPKLVDRAVERERSGIAVDFLLGCQGGPKGESF